MSWRLVHAVGDRLTPRLQRALVKALREAQGKVPIGKLIEIMQRRGLSTFEIGQVLDSLPALLMRAAQPIQTAVLRSVTIAYKEAVRLDFAPSLDRVNPAAVRAAQTQIAKLVTAVSAESR